MIAATNPAPETSPPAEATPAPFGKDPARLVQRAWNVYRLPHLQELVRSAIVVLEREERPELVGLQEGAAPCGSDPIAEALRMCREELLAASGIPGADAARAEHISVLRRSMRDEPHAWSEAFTAALETYRCAATRVLEQVLGPARAA